MLARGLLSRFLKLLLSLSEGSSSYCEYSVSVKNLYWRRMRSFNRRMCLRLSLLLDLLLLFCWEVGESELELSELESRSVMNRYLFFWKDLFKRSQMLSINIIMKKIAYIINITPSHPTDSKPSTIFLPNLLLPRAQPLN